MHSLFVCIFFFFNDTATTEIYTLSLHDALPIWEYSVTRLNMGNLQLDSVVELEVVTLTGSVFDPTSNSVAGVTIIDQKRSEEHTSELQSRPHLVCRLLLEKKKKKH